MNPTLIAARRSAALTALPVMLALVAANTLGRNRTWEHEWVWAHYQYAFVTVLFGPLAAGIAAWDGVRLGRARVLLGTSDRTLQALVAAWFGAAIWVLATYATGLLFVDALVKISGTPGWPPPAALVTPLPGAALLLAQAAAGISIGWWLRHPLAAPAASIGCFLLTLWLYTSGPGELVVVGGATASLVNLTPRLSMQALQVVWFATATAAALVAAARLSGWGRRPARWQLPVVSCLCLIAVVPLLHQGETYLVPTSDQQVCTGVAPQVCVAPGYARFAVTTRTALLPYLRALSRIDAPVPTQFRQNVEPGQQSVGPIESRLILGDRHQAGFAVLAAYLSKKCPIDGNQKLSAQFNGLTYWLYATVDGQRPPDPTVPAVVTGPATTAQRQWLLAAIDSLRRCS